MPSTSITPLVGSSRKLMHRRSVLFPEPDRPKRTTTSPGMTLRLIPFRTSSGPKYLWRFSTRTRGRPSVGVDTELSDVALAQAPLQPSLEVREHRCQGPVHDCGEDESLQVAEIGLPGELGPPEQLHGCQARPEDAHQGRVLEHGDELVAGGRDDHPERLRQHHTAHQLTVCHAEGLSGLVLTVAHRLDPR